MGSISTLALEGDPVASPDQHATQVRDEGLVGANRGEIWSAVIADAVTPVQNRHNFAVLQNPTQPRGLIHRSVLFPEAARIPIAPRGYRTD